MKINFSNMTPAQIRIKKSELESSLPLYDEDDSAIIAQYHRTMNGIAQCQCALYSDRILKGMGISRKDVMEEAMRLAILDDMGVGVEDLEISETTISFKCQTWQSVNAFVKKFQHKANVKIESHNMGSLNDGGYYTITAYLSQSQTLLAA